MAGMHKDYRPNLTYLETLIIRDALNAHVRTRYPELTYAMRNKFERAIFRMKDPARCGK